MILADKILTLRKKCGWSQEELADKLQVSRQSVSKWESAQSIPDINKILDLARVFGVSTDYLLKDEVEAPEFTGTDEDSVLPVVTLKEANDFLASGYLQGRRIGLGVFLCIISPICLILLAGLSEFRPSLHLTEGAAAAIGIAVLLLLVAGAVALFIFTGLRCERFEYLKKNDFSLEYGVSGVVKEKRAAFQGRFAALMVAGVALCILSPLPLIVIGAAGGDDITCVFLTGLLLFLVACGVYCFIYAGCVRECCDRLLRQGEFDRAEIEKNRASERFGGFYWPVVTAIYLGWSFLTRDWHITWVVWPVAGLLFAGISALLHREN